MNIKTIAKLAGVSQTTVTNVLNGNTKKMTKETFLKVKQVIKETGYVRRVAPMLLHGNGVRVFGIIVGEDEEKRKWNLCGWMMIVLEKELYQMGYYVIFHISSNEKDILAFIKTWNLAGILYISQEKQVIEHIGKECSLPYFAREAAQRSEKREKDYIKEIKHFLKMLSDKTLL